MEPASEARSQCFREPGANLWGVCNPSPWRRYYFWLTRNNLYQNCTDPILHSATEPNLTKFRHHRICRSRSRSHCQRSEWFEETRIESWRLRSCTLPILSIKKSTKAMRMSCGSLHAVVTILLSKIQRVGVRAKLYNT